VAVSPILSLGCVAVELELLTVVENLPVPAHNIVCPMLVRCTADLLPTLIHDCWLRAKGCVRVSPLALGCLAILWTG